MAGLRTRDDKHRVRACNEQRVLEHVIFERYRTCDAYVSKYVCMHVHRYIHACIHTVTNPM